MITSIYLPDTRYKAWRDLALALIQAQQWQEAERVIRFIHAS